MSKLIEVVRASVEAVRPPSPRGTDATDAMVKQRVGAILSAPEAEGRRQLALHIALSTELSADTAIRLLAAAPLSISVSEFGAAMQQLGNPQLGPGAWSPSSNREDAGAAAWEDAFARAAQEESSQIKDGRH